MRICLSLTRPAYGISGPSDASHVKEWNDIWLHTMTGFHEEAFQELRNHKGDPEFENATLTLDEMSLKSYLNYDPKLKRNFGYVDHGGNTNITGSNEIATDALVVMLVSMRGRWKLPLGYMLTKSITADVQAGIIREALRRSFDAGVRVRVLTMDGTAHNTSTYKALGCNLLPTKISGMKVDFPHPHKDANYRIYGMLDPPHMIKLVRNILAEYWELYWPGKGMVKWAYIVRLQETQKAHQGVRLANKITNKHISYKANKMKVYLATQLFSRSVAKSLRWCHEQNVPGFESKDVLVTAEFVSLHNDLFDVLNSRALTGKGLKAALTVDNLHIAQETFRKFEQLYDVLQGPDGKKVIHSRRKTGPLGFISCIKTVEKLVADMKKGILPLQHLRCYRLQQDSDCIKFLKSYHENA